MTQIKLIDKSQTYEVMDLWMRTTTHANPFIEQNFWETHYDYVKERINNNETFVCMEDGRIVGFTCVTPDNMIQGIYVDTDYQGKGFGGEIMNFLKREYSILHIKVYAKNRKAFEFAEKAGFIIDGALRREDNNEIMYTMLWSQQ